MYLGVDSIPPPLTVTKKAYIVCDVRFIGTLLQKIMRYMIMALYFRTSKMVYTTKVSGHSQLGLQELSDLLSPFQYMKPFY
jgi:hypothetical protein